MNEVEFSEFLLNGELEVTGRLVDASNATLYGRVSRGQESLSVIYKPVAGERPLWDFETGTLAKRERAAYLLSELSGFAVIPTTVLRDGPFGEGAVQRWIEVDQDADLISFGRSDHERLRAMALFDAVANNTDRKFGHILIAEDGEIFGCDHGVTFHVEDKLRTVLWQFAGLNLTSSEIEQLQGMVKLLTEDRGEIHGLLTSVEVAATVTRIERLLEQRAFPFPAADWPAVPWPPV